MKQIKESAPNAPISSELKIPDIRGYVLELEDKLIRASQTISYLQAEIEILNDETVWEHIKRKVRSFFTADN